MGWEGGSNPLPLGSSICLALELTLLLLLLLAFFRWRAKTLVGDLGQLPRTLVCVWTYRKHGWARGDEHLQGPEKDASRWPRNQSTLWGPMIEADNFLEGRTVTTQRRPAEQGDTEMKPILAQELIQMLVLLTTDERENITPYSKLTLPLCVFCCFLICSAFSTFNFSYILLLWIIKTDDSQIMKD